MTEPYPLSGSIISEISGILVRARRKEDAIKLMYLAIYHDCFTWEGGFHDVFRLEEEGGVWTYKTARPGDVTVNKYASERFCNVYGFEFEKF